MNILEMKIEDLEQVTELASVRLKSNLIRTKAHQFYLKQGYVIKKSWHLFVKNL